MSDWWRHLMEHLGINTTNYFLYDERTQSDPAPYQSSCISIKPAPLHRFYGKIWGLKGPVVAEGLVGEVELRSQILEQEVHATAEQADV